jgi:hypothetical protein
MSAPANGKRPHKKPLNKLEAHEISEIDRLIEIRQWQHEEEVRSFGAPGDGIDISQYWMRRDPSWHFVLARLKGVDPNDWDRVIQQAIKDLFRTDIPVGPYTKAYLEAFCVCPPDPKDREDDQDQTLAHVIVHEVDWLTDLLDDKQRAQAYAAHHWRKVARGRFSSGPALNMWVRRALNKKHPKMLSAHGRSKRSDEG